MALTKIKNNCSIYTPIGSNIMPVYGRKYDEKTKTNFVVKIDEFDVDEFIQASETKTDLAMLRQQMMATGQIPVIDDTVVDATLFPENIHELMKTVKDAGNTFDQLPASIKQIFGTSDKFLASLVDGSYSSKVQAGLEVQVKAAQQQAQQEVNNNVAQ